MAGVGTRLSPGIWDRSWTPLRPDICPRWVSPAQRPSVKDRRRRWFRKLKDRYRLLLINDSTFEERFSMRLNRLNVLVLAVLAFGLYGRSSSLPIVFTPLKRYIPGMPTRKRSSTPIGSQVEADSLEQMVVQPETGISTNLRWILSGESNRRTAPPCSHRAT